MGSKSRQEMLCGIVLTLLLLIGFPGEISGADGPGGFNTVSLGSAQAQVAGGDRQAATGLSGNREGGEIPGESSTGLDLISAQAGSVLLSPQPKQVRWLTTSCRLPACPSVGARSLEDLFLGRLLAAELGRLHRLDAAVVVLDARDMPKSENTTAKSQVMILRLMRADTPEAQTLLKSVQSWAQWPPPRNAAESALDLEPQSTRHVRTNG